MKYDSRPDTWKHIHTVQSLLKICIEAFIKRSLVHDQSKLESPEVEVFDEMTPKLAGSTYGSDEYKGFLKEMGVGLEHHYAHNSHHPEHHPTGIRGMNLFDVVEMLCDWKAATMRHNDGDSRRAMRASSAAAVQ